MPMADTSDLKQTIRDLIAEHEPLDSPAAHDKLAGAIAAYIRTALLVERQRALGEAVQRANAWNAPALYGQRRSEIAAKIAADILLLLDTG
jgi:hypothetical protein